jgi:hypothetical protein
MSYRYKYNAAFEDDAHFMRYHLMVWKQERCMQRDERYDDWGALRALEHDFYEWCRETGTPLPQSGLFEHALLSLGYRVQREMVASLFLKADAWALEKH